MIEQKVDKYKCFRQDRKGVLWFGDRLVFPKNPELRKKILDEAHLSKFSMHPGSNKMYHDLRSLYWWTRMKREITKYISECDTCQSQGQSFEGGRHLTVPSHTILEMGGYLHGFHCGIAQYLPAPRCYLGHYG
jgi:hypothetical protein